MWIDQMKEDQINICFFISIVFNLYIYSGHFGFMFWHEMSVLTTGFRLFIWHTTLEFVYTYKTIRQTTTTSGTTKCSAYSIVTIMSILSFVNDPLTTSSIRETFNWDSDTSIALFCVELVCYTIHIISTEVTFFQDFLGTRQLVFNSLQ